MSEFHAEAPQVTESKALVQGPYVAASAGFKQATLQTKDDESTNEPPRPTIFRINYIFLIILAVHELL